MGDSAGLLVPIVFLAIMIFYIYVGWRIFEKADKPGWAAIIPVYNQVVTLRMVGRPVWWIILAFIPVLNLIWLIIPIDLAKSFGKGVGYGIGLMLLGPIFAPMLAFGDAEYQGPAAADDAAAAAA